MKRSLVFLFLILPCLSYAQHISFGVNAGVGMNSEPTGNVFYKGNQPTLNYAGHINALYSVLGHWQAGLQIDALELSDKSSTSYSYYHGSTIGNDGKKFVYSKIASSLSVVFNGKWNLINSYLYLGVAAGYGVARNYKAIYGQNESYEAPDGGLGPVVGGQLGYVYGITSRLGVNIEAALRYYNLSYDAQAPMIHSTEKLHYQAMAYNATVGIRYRLVRHNRF
ncbi:MAG TPA: hypothetical protein VN721_02330 [Flavipsychrobacter sp.]|nr:hypothetical protein [Flavipsychrobacter sp.]